jgi:hypothetical protein
MRRVLSVWLVAGAVATAVWLVWPSQPRSDEELIRAAIDDMAECAGSHDLSGLLKHVSEKYRGEGGDREELKRSLAGTILRSDWVAAIPTAVRITVEGDRARVALVVLLARSPARAPAEVAPEALAGSRPPSCGRTPGESSRRREGTPPPRTGCGDVGGHRGLSPAATVRNGVVARGDLSNGWRGRPERVGEADDSVRPMNPEADESRS